MRLSDAIRLGSMMKPQCFGQLFDGVGTCAAGAAFDAVGALVNCTKAMLALPLLADENFKRIDCPECWLPYSQRIGNSTLAHLNDHHYWTRERIADWVETIEQQQEAKPQPVAEAVTVP